MPNLSIAHVKAHMDRPADGGPAIGYTINSDNDVTITGNVSSQALATLLRVMDAGGYVPQLASGALKFRFRNF